MKPSPFPFETLLIIATLTGMTFVPQTTVPFWAWPLLLGLGNLGLILSHVVRFHSLLKEDMAPLLAAVLCLVLAIAIPLDRGRTAMPFLVALASMLIAGAIWSAWQAREP